MKAFENLTDQQKKELDSLLEKFRIQNESLKVSFFGAEAKLFHKSNKYFSVESTDKRDLFNLLKVLPPDKENYKVSNHVSETNLIVSLHNPIRGQHQVSFIWNHQDVRVQLSLPIETISDFVVSESRKVYDCEYHYFVGESLKNIMRKEIPSKKFKDYRNTINWYGGDKSTLNKEVINAIVSSLK